jgi:hypothetical protein
MTKKIHIEDVFTAFQKFQIAQRQGISSVREPKKWQAAMDKAQAEFKKEIGDLANHIDWSKR